MTGRRQPRTNETIGPAGGLVVAGLVAAGAILGMLIEVGGTVVDGVVRSVEPTVASLWLRLERAR